ncbi:MAG: hypothetical protein APR56_00385, partial [Methanosaeta sp. SDB]
DLISGREVELRAQGAVTDCYPRFDLETTLRLDDFNQATMVNPRNSYERYAAAANSTERTLHTYMGTLLPRYGNISYSGAGALSPIPNDPDFEYIGVGTRIFLCGAQGFIVGSGTQHLPQEGFSTLMVKGDLKDMKDEFLRAATFQDYGPSLYVGIGVPIPVLNEGIAKKTAVRDRDIVTEIVDYGVPRRARPTVRKVNYEQLYSGFVDIDGNEVKASALSSRHVARKVARALGDSIKRGEFFLSASSESLPREGRNRPMKQTKEFLLVGDVMSPKVVTVREEISIKEAAQMIVGGTFDHLPVVSAEERLIGMVTAWDISKAVASGKTSHISDMMTRKVFIASPDEPLELAARKLDHHKISALPVVDKDHHVIGMVTSDQVSRLYGRRRFH